MTAPEQLIAIFISVILFLWVVVYLFARDQQKQLLIHEEVERQKRFARRQIRSLKTK